MTVTLATQFGRYSIVRKLGEGGMGAVYLAEDGRLRRQVAIKVPNFTEAEDPRLIERFYREARLAGQVHHPNLCPIHDVDAHDGIHYLTMAYIEGTPLIDLLHPERPWTPDQALAVLRPLCSVLHLLHERGIVHRDLKPGNVMIRPDGSPVLMDFGLARCYSHNSQRLTTEGRPLGTPSYMAPEQVIADEGGIGPHTDVWALGVILYQLLTGKLPFLAPTFVELGMRIVHADPTPLSHHRPALEEHWNAICMRAIAKDHRQRPATAQAFARALESTRIAGVPNPDVTLSPYPAPPTHAAELHPTLNTDRMTGRDHPTLPQRRRRWPFAVAGAALALLTGAAWFLGGPTNKGETPDSVTPPAAVVTPGAGEPITNSIGMELVLLPAGRFTMGSPASELFRYDDEGPQHVVEISKAFYMGVHEVTQEQYRQVMRSNPSHFSPTGRGAALVPGLDTGRFPVDGIRWEDAVLFCQKLSELPAEKAAGRVYRLPTEAEWEYACRGGAKEYQVFNVGDSLSAQQANFDGDNPYGSAPTGPDLGRTTTVGRYPANAWGLHDMHGNVWEWCSDWYGDNYYHKSARRDPRGPATGEMHILRGGSWANNGLDCRSAYRDRDDVTDRLARIGFRVVSGRTNR